MSRMTPVQSVRVAGFLRLLLLPGLCLLAGALCAQTSVIAVDVYNKKIHMESGANVKRPVGGLAKVATALVALDWSDVTKVPMNTLATVSPTDLQIAGSNSLGLAPGDQITLRDLVYAAMMSSDNVAATTLAAFVGNDINARRGRGGDPIGTFVGEMNKLAAREGMKKTRFTNPHGFENSRNAPFSTAADMARLSMYAISRASFRFYTNQRSRNITVLRGGAPLTVPLQNTNALLRRGNIDGIKTGNTPMSGGCVIVTEERPGTVSKDAATGASVVYRHRMVTVVLGSGDPFTEALAVLQQGWGGYDQWLQAGRPVHDAKELLGTF
ncbi:MAG TPA: serine hydrolase [Candidatus Saccharimonadia bacterium]|nr:serine hydrolase [Candidatus Saccharimonadia bacterium]